MQESWQMKTDNSSFKKTMAILKLNAGKNFLEKQAF
jgi:hypothetical protein